MLLARVIAQASVDPQDSEDAATIAAPTVIQTTTTAMASTPTTAELGAVGLAFAHGFEAGFQADAFASRPTLAGVEDATRTGRPGQYQHGFVDGYNTRHRIVPPPVVAPPVVPPVVAPPVVAAPPQVVSMLLCHVNWLFGQSEFGSMEHQVAVMSRDWLLGFRL